MNRLLLATVGLAILVPAGMLIVNRAQAQVGPDNQPATLRTWMDQNPAPVNSTAGAFSPGLPAFAGGLPQLPDFQPKPDPNRDLFVTPAQGPWHICVTCYSGAQSPQLAREMVVELRERYKLPAFVFSKGDEARREEFERVKKIIEEHHRFCLEKNIPLDPHWKVKTRRIEDEYAILVGSYKDADAAGGDLEKIRNLPPPQNKNLCSVALFPELSNPDEDKLSTRPPATSQSQKQRAVEPKYLSPFKGAFVVHNPTIKQERPADWDKLDMAVLRRLNRGENYTLLNCKKQFTLVVKQFLLPAETRSIKDGNVFGKINPFAHQSDIDVQAHNAHNLADLLHKTAHLDAFVLHTKYASMVTVGAFDSIDDPAMRSTQEMLKNQFRIPLPLPMAVPR